MRVLVACEFSGAVRRAFAELGHDAWSCDLLPAEDGSPKHYQADVTELNGLLDFDLIVAHPPCRFLSKAGSRWWPERQQEQTQAAEFVLWLADLQVPRIGIENPVGRLSTVWRKPDQIIHPWMFGDPYMKETCLWLKGLPKLEPTQVVDRRESWITKVPPGKDRWKVRSRTFPGIARAMAHQWGAAQT